MNSFRKEERLCSKKLIDELFHKGSSFLLYPFRIVWLVAELPYEAPVQVLISVPKKRFKRAVDRNLIRRRIREVYRVHKQEYLYPAVRQQTTGLLLALTFIGNEIPDSAFIGKKLPVALTKLSTNFADDGH